MRFHIVTLGCPKNVVDSESMERLLSEAGYEATPDPKRADIVIVNTCGFIEAAKQESVGAILEAAQAKRAGQGLIAAGCLVQRYETNLVSELPAIDGALGTRRWNEIVSVVDSVAEKLDGKPAARPPRPLISLPFTQPAVVRPSAYVKVADGCDRPCAFCAIPLIKGHFASRPIDDIVADARRLAGQGVKEIVLVAQETSAYGFDRGEHDGLPRLMERLSAEVSETPWLRFLYAYPTTVSPRLIDTWARLPQWQHYLDMPLQHAHPDVLRRMRRPHDLARTRNVIADLRAAMPDIALRTTFIVGYPGETEAEFQTLLDFMSEIRFDNVGVFTYSQEDGTPAGGMPAQLPEEIKRERFHWAMAHQQAISLERNRAFVGKTLDVLVEGVAEQVQQRRNGKGQQAYRSLHIPTQRLGNGKPPRRRQRQAAPDEPLLVGRCYRHAPEIDGLVLAHGQARLGDMVRARITSATEYDLWGEVVPAAL